MWVTVLQLLQLIIEELHAEAEADVQVACMEVFEDVVMDNIDKEHGGIAAVLAIGDTSGEGGAEAIVEVVEAEALGTGILEVLDIRRLDGDDGADTAIGQIANQRYELEFGTEAQVLELVALEVGIIGELNLILVHAVGGIDVRANGRRELMPAELETYLEVVEEVEGGKAVEGVTLHADIAQIALHLQVVVVVDVEMVIGDAIHLIGDETVDKHLAKPQHCTGVQAGATGMKSYHPRVVLGRGRE